MVVAVIALVASLVGTATAATLISGRSIRRNSIPADRIKRNALGGRQINERRLNRVPRARIAEAAGTALSVGGQSIRKVVWRAGRGSPEQLILDVNGLQLYARCLTGGDVRARAVTSVPDTDAAVAVVRATDVSAGGANKDFDPGESLSLDQGAGTGAAAGTFTYVRGDGVNVTLPFSVSGGGSCLLTGTATTG